MRSTFSVVIVGSLLLAWTGLARSGEGDDAKALVAKAIKAMGGADNLAKHKAATWKEKGTYYGMGDGVPYVGNYAQQLPGQFRMEIEGVFTMVLNGDQGWTSAGGETKDMSKEELATTQNNQKAGYIASLVPLQDKGFTLTTLKDSKVGDAAAVGVKVTRKDYPEVKLYFAKDSGMLLMSEFRTKAAEMENKEVTATMHFSNYKDIDGAQVPTKVVMKRDGKVYVEAEVTEYKAAAKLDAKVFAKP